MEGCQTVCFETTIGRLTGAPMIRMSRLETPVTGDPRSRASAVEATRVYDVKLYFIPFRDRVGGIV